MNIKIYLKIYVYYLLDYLIILIKSHEPYFLLVCCTNVNVPNNNVFKKFLLCNKKNDFNNIFEFFFYFIFRKFNNYDIKTYHDIKIRIMLLC